MVFPEVKPARGVSPVNPFGSPDKTADLGTVQYKREITGVKNLCLGMPPDTDQYRSEQISKDQYRSEQISKDQYRSVQIRTDQYRSEQISTDQ